MAFDRKAELERIGAERAAAEQLASQERNRALLRALLGVAGSCAAGLFVMFFAFRVNDYELGMIFFWSAMVVAYGGMAYFLLSAYVEGERRGDW